MLDTQAQEAKQSAPLAPLMPTLPEAADFIVTQHDRRNPPQNSGNKQKAAQVLGLSRQGLIKKLKRLSINQ